MAEDQNANPAHQSPPSKTGGNASILGQAQSIPRLANTAPRPTAVSKCKDIPDSCPGSQQHKDILKEK